MSRELLWSGSARKTRRSGVLIINGTYVPRFLSYQPDVGGGSDAVTSSNPLTMPGTGPVAGRAGASARPVRSACRLSWVGEASEVWDMGLAPLKVGAFFFGGVEMDDAGAGAPAPMDRRYSNEACWDATRKYIDAAVAAEAVGIRLVLDHRAPLPV